VTPCFLQWYLRRSHARDVSLFILPYAFSSGFIPHNPREYELRPRRVDINRPMATVRESGGEKRASALPFMRSRFTISSEELEKLDAEMSALPPKTPHEFTKLDAIRRLRPRIAEMLARGYTFEDIAQWLSNSGLQIATTVLRSYWSSTKDGTEGAAKNCLKSERSAAATTGPAKGGARHGRRRSPRGRQETPPPGPAPAPLATANASGARSAEKGAIAAKSATATTSAPTPPVRQSLFTVKEDTEKL
jgi:hypothetical protein